MDISKLVSPAVEAEVLREQNEAQAARIKELEKQLLHNNPAAPFTEKVKAWFQDGEGRIIFEDIKHFCEKREEEKEALIEKWHNEQMRLAKKHKPILDRFQQLTGATMDMRALFGFITGEGEE